MKLELKRKSIVVRPYKASDYLAWREAFSAIQTEKKNEWDVSRRQTSELTRARFRTLLRNQKKNRDQDHFFDLGIFLKDGTLVGGVSIMDISRQVFQNAYLGYRIFHNHWGKGYGRIGVQLGIEIAFKELNLHRLEAGISPRNRRSLALAKSAGMRREGYSKRRLFLEGRWQDMVLYVITSEDLGLAWKPRAEKRVARF